MRSSILLLIALLLPSAAGAADSCVTTDECSRGQRCSTEIGDRSPGYCYLPASALMRRSLSGDRSILMRWRERRKVLRGRPEALRADPGESRSLVRESHLLKHMNPDSELMRRYLRLR